MGDDDVVELSARIRRGLRGNPLVAGVAGGVGTTTVATAIGGIDRGVFTGRPVDVLVCRPTADSLVRAARAAHLVTTQGTRPVLAVSAIDGVGPSRPGTARLRLLEPHTAAVVVLPHVRRWREMVTPLDDLTGLLTRPLPELPRPLRHYASAVRDVHTALESALDHPHPPPRPVSAVAPHRQVRRSPSPAPGSAR